MAKSNGLDLDIDRSFRQKKSLIASAWAKNNSKRYKNYQEAYRSKRYTDHSSWARYKISQIKMNAERKNVPFDLTVEQLLSLIPKDLKCPALGIPLVFERGAIRWYVPSIDRMVPKKGYVFDNVCIISFRANAIKQDSIDSSEVRRVADYMDRVYGNG